jgi:hypothetical protein
MIRTHVDVIVPGFPSFSPLFAHTEPSSDLLLRTQHSSLQKQVETRKV